jgi:hypothetical protein
VNTVLGNGLRADQPAAAIHYRQGVEYGRKSNIQNKQTYTARRVNEGNAMFGAIRRENSRKKFRLAIRSREIGGGRQKPKFKRDKATAATQFSECETARGRLAVANALLAHSFDSMIL